MVGKCAWPLVPVFGFDKQVLFKNYFEHLAKPGLGSATSQVILNCVDLNLGGRRALEMF